MLLSPATGTIEWSVGFEPARIYRYPVQTSNQISASAEGLDGVALRWRTENHVRSAYRVEIDGEVVGVSFEPHASVRGLTPGRAAHIAVRSIWSDGTVAENAAEIFFTPPRDDLLPLGELEPAFVRQEWRNLWRRLGSNRSVAGTPLTIGGATYQGGIGSHAGWDVHYRLRGGFSRFTATIGIDDEVRAAQKQPNEVLFELWGDGRLTAVVSGFRRTAIVSGFSRTGSGG
jgi:NPCBM/NEW2 domain-containing protein